MHKLIPTPRSAYSIVVDSDDQSPTYHQHTVVCQRCIPQWSLISEYPGTVWPERMLDDVLKALDAGAKRRIEQYCIRIRDTPKIICPVDPRTMALDPDHASHAALFTNEPSSGHPSCVYVADATEDRVYLVSTRDIAEGELLTTSYGEDFNRDYHIENRTIPVFYTLRHSTMTLEKAGH